MNTNDTHFTKDTTIEEVANSPLFGDYGRLIFPVDKGYMSGNTLGEIDLAWYSNIDSSKTVEIINYMGERAARGETVFYNIYSDAERREEPDKQNTGLFFFKGEPGKPFAIVNAGGGFSYVASIHDSFPQALELSKNGYNAFALIYRPETRKAYADLARAINFIVANSEEFEVDSSNYSLWGGSAGARAAATVGRYGPHFFGEDDLPRPNAVITQYTGFNTYSEDDPPTYACVGKNDFIADWTVMKDRLRALSNIGIDTEFHAYPGLRHGFGLGTNTVADGWIQDAIAFWQRQIENKDNNPL